MATTTMNPAMAAETPTTEATDHVPLKTWICVIGVLLGCFMAVLDIIVTNSSLRDIAGTLAASSDEISWVPTSYLVAEIVVISVDLVALCCVLTEEISSGELDLVRLLLCLLRTGTFSGFHDPLSRPAGFYGWRADSTFLRRDPHLPSAVEESNWHGHVHHHRNFRSCVRAAPRRMADRQLRMAIHLLHQCHSRMLLIAAVWFTMENAAHESGPAEKR